MLCCVITKNLKMGNLENSVQNRTEAACHWQAVTIQIPKAFSLKMMFHKKEMKRSCTWLHLVPYHRAAGTVNSIGLGAALLWQVLSLASFSIISNIFCVYLDVTNICNPFTNIWHPDWLYSKISQTPEMQ